MSTLHEKLKSHKDTIQSKTLSKWFAAEPGRVQEWTLHHAGIYLDLSKNHINTQTKALWQQWVDSAGVAEGIAAITRGDNVNTGEHRPALHHRLRAPADQPFVVNGEDVSPHIRDVRARMKNIAERVRSGEWKGFDGQAITDVIHIGIGGSELGPRLLCTAFKHLADDRIRVHFLATPDPVKIS